MSAEGRSMCRLGGGRAMRRAKVPRRFPAEMTPSVAFLAMVTCSMWEEVVIAYGGVGKDLG